MPCVADLVGPEVLERLAKPANLSLGQAIVAQQGVKIEVFGPLHVIAKVGGVAAADQRRTVELVAEPSGLRWSCACSRRLDLFCKHCIATALVVRRGAPSRLP